MIGTMQSERGQGVVDYVYKQIDNLNHNHSRMFIKPTSMVEGPLAVAYVNHGRWVCDCPLCRDGSDYVDFEGQKFYCFNCGNGSKGGQWIPILVPQLDYRKKIEGILEARPNKDNQNWIPGETLDKLIAENIQHGVS